ncbi:hypothetical protein GCM10029964_093440 [Kibdelosporangium lantanae]
MNAVKGDNMTESAGTGAAASDDQANAGTEPIRLQREFTQKPHAVYEHLRQSGPIHQVSLRAGLGVWLVTDYHLARELLADPRLSKDNARALKLYPPGTAGANASPLGANLCTRTHPRTPGFAAWFPKPSPPARSRSSGPTSNAASTTCSMPCQKTPVGQST